MRTEFLGISGVGKTHVATQYAEYLYVKGVNYTWPWQSLYGKKNYMRRNIEKGYGVVGCLLKRPRWCIRLLRVLLSHRAIGLKGGVILFYNGIYLKSVFGKCDGTDDISIFDEGVVQYIWAIHLRDRKSPTSKEIGDFFSLFGKPDRLYVVDASVETIEHRLKSRGVIDRIRDKADLKENIRNMYGIMNDMVSILSDTYNVPIVRINNEIGSQISFGSNESSQPQVAYE